MKRNLRLLIGAILMSANIFAQSDSIKTTNTADRLLSSNNKLLIGGYAQVDYNQEIDSDIWHNGNLDVHRMVMLFGYAFSPKTKFITEIEFEHVKEVYVEQAFLQHKLHKYVNLRAGLMLVPMGIINEYHEPTAFHGVERPMIDKYLSPTTWREIGIGLTGNIPDASLKYQAYIMNGFNGYDGNAKFSEAKGLRSGRQKGAESYMSWPCVSAKADYYGVKNFNLGLAGYFGKSQSTAFEGIDKNDGPAMTEADSTVVGIAMMGFDARYNHDGFEAKLQYYLISLTNTGLYNTYTGADVSKLMDGLYLELAYDIFHNNDKVKDQVLPFIRYSVYNTQGGLVQNNGDNKTYITGGIDWKLDKGAVFKLDLQLNKNAVNNKYNYTIDVGVGVMF